MIRATAAVAASPLSTLPFSTSLASDRSIPDRARSSCDSDTSTRVTSKPATAATCAIPEPIWPAPDDADALGHGAGTSSTIASP